MIPASYLFKDIYYRQWEKEQVVPPAPEHQKPNGTTTPAWHLMLALLHRRAKPGRHSYGVHAYD